MQLGIENNDVYLSLSNNTESYVNLSCYAQLRYTGIQLYYGINKNVCGEKSNHGDVVFQNTES